MIRWPHASLLALALVVACKGHDGSGLPPPTGSGAPPAPSIPRLDVGASAPVASAATESAWTGTIYARHEAQLGPKMSGILAAVLVGEGDRVKKGQPLFRLDSAQASLAVNQAKTAVGSAQVSFDDAKLQFERSKELIKSGAISPTSFDQSKLAYDRASSGVEQAKVALQMAERSLTDSTVTSPIDGVVTAKLKSVGETVTMMPPTVVLVVQDIEKLELRARLPERALSFVKEGGPLRMTARSVNVTRDVTVKRVNPTLDARTRTVEVVADVENPDGTLKVGMLVEVAAPGVPGPAEGSGAPSGSAFAGTPPPGAQ